MKDNKPKNSQEKFKSRLGILNNIAQRILLNKNLEETSKSILESLTFHLNAFGGIIFFPDSEHQNLVVHSYSNRPIINKVVGLVPFDVFKVRYDLSSKELLLSKCAQTNTIVKSKKLSDFLYPAFRNKTLLDLIQRIIRVKLCFGIPIKVNDKLLGVLFVAFKKEKLSKTDLGLLEFYSNLSSIAIDHNHKIESLEKQYENEKETTSILSHEIKTPIAINHNGTQMISLILNKYRSQIPEKAYHELNAKLADMTESVRRMSDVCNSIFHLREVETHIPEDIHELNLPRQFHLIIENFERLAQKKGLKFTYSIPDHHKGYYAAVIQFEQVVTILLDNALKYTTRGSINLEIDYEEDSLLCYITDTGIGIPKNQRNVIFNRFYRNKKQSQIKTTKGLGLGLYIAKKIVGILNGEILVQNNPSGPGTEFTVKIPIYKTKKIIG